MATQPALGFNNPRRGLLVTMRHKPVTTPKIKTPKKEPALRNSRINQKGKRFYDTIID
eukprot:jgi/Mesvir1/26080/Mv26357-RA.1